MSELTRRTLIAGASSLPLAACAGFDRSAAPASNPPETFIVDVNRQPDEIFRIWPGSAPGGENTDLNEHYVSRENPFGLPDRAIRDVTNPTLSYFKAAEPSGLTLLLIPGGGYSHVVVEKEGFEGARYFNQFGINAYVMNYRLPHQGWTAGPDTPLQDAQRAIRLVRQRAGSDAHIAIMGFSAGGHVAGSLTQRFDERVYEPIDEADSLSARPDLSALIYPVALMGSEFTHKGSETNLLGKAPSSVQLARHDLAHAPNPESPPVFLLHALDDGSVPFENSLELAASYRRSKVSAVLHSFVSGGHGFGMRGIEDTPLSAWPGLFINWANAQLA